MKPITRMLDSIPHRGLRRATGLALMLGFSLLLALVLEQTSDQKTLEGMKAAQTQWIKDVSALTPMGMVDGYLGDVAAAASGQWVYERPPEAGPKRGPRALAPAPSAAELACEQARASRASRPSCAARFPGSQAACMAGQNPDPSCADYLKCLADQLNMLAEPFECLTLPRRPMLDLPLATQNPVPLPSIEPTSDSQQLHLILIPLAALVHGATRIIDGGLWTILLAVFQLGVGFAAFNTITSAISKSGKAGFGDGWSNYILLPICVIVLGSIVALILQGFMLGTLYLFSWITGLAAAAAGATGLGGAAWWTFNKLAEKGIEEVVTKRV